MSLSRNFNELFIYPEDEGMNWRNMFFELGKKGDKDSLTKMFDDANELYFEESKILEALSNFTKDLPIDEKTKLLKNLSKDDNYNVEIHKSHIRIESDNIKIDALTLSDVFEELKTIYPEIETKQRFGNCHIRSIEISFLIKDPNKVVTGFIYDISDKIKFLHSWVETSINNTDVVIDFTMNIIINKNAYYKLQHAEPLNSISDKDLIKDNDFIHFFSQNVNSVNIKEYLLFRDEIIHDCMKNKQLFGNIDFSDEER